MISTMLISIFMFVYFVPLAKTYDLDALINRHSMYPLSNLILPIDPNDPTRYNKFKQTMPYPLVTQGDCISPFKYDKIKNNCFVHKQSDFFEDNIDTLKCMFGEIPEKGCQAFDMKNTCKWMKEHLGNYKLVDCHDGLSEVCVYDQNPEAQHIREKINFRDYFSTGTKRLLISDTHHDVYFHKDLRDIVNVEKEWKLLIAKFKLCFEFFKRSIPNFDIKYQFQVEKWCMLNSILEYYVNYNDFENQINVSKLTKYDVQTAYKNISEKYKPQTLKTLILTFEDNKAKNSPFESAFIILLLDPEDERSLDLNYCFDTR